MKTLTRVGLINSGPRVPISELCGYRSLSSARTSFEQKPHDIFSVELDDVIGGLQLPQISSGCGLAHLFPGTVDVKEL